MASGQLLLMCWLLVFVQGSPILRHFLYDAAMGVDVVCDGGVKTIATLEGDSVQQCAVSCVAAASSCNAFNFKLGSDGCELLQGTCTSTSSSIGSSFYQVSP